jgi:hypothetical protein
MIGDQKTSVAMASTAMAPIHADHSTASNPSNRRSRQTYVNIDLPLKDWLERLIFNTRLRLGGKLPMQQLLPNSDTCGRNTTARHGRHGMIRFVAAQHAVARVRVAGRSGNS